MIIQINKLYEATGTAKLADLPEMIAAAKNTAGLGGEITLAGPGPVWLYLAVAHALHGVARRLVYNSPVTGDVIIFDHSC